MKAVFLSLITALFLLSNTAYAIGIFTLKGQLKGFTEKTYLITNNNFTYEVKKASLNPEQLALLKGKKTGDSVELMISTQAVETAYPTKSK